MTPQELEQQPAFPLPFSNDAYGDPGFVAERGPTLLIEFTKAAMQGILTNPAVTEEVTYALVANRAVNQAKATLAELAKEMP